MNWTNILQLLNTRKVWHVESHVQQPGNRIGLGQTFASWANVPDREYGVNERVKKIWNTVAMYVLYIKFIRRGTASSEINARGTAGSESLMHVVPQAQKV